MRSKKRTIGILIVVIVVLLGFASSLLVYRNKLSSENQKNNSNNTAQSLSSAPSGKSIENFYDKPITDEKIALDSIEVNRDKLGYSDKNFTFIYDEKSSSKTAYHFDLFYKGIPVHSPVGIRGVSVITHYDNSAKVLITGVSDSDKIIKVNTTPKIAQDEANDIIKKQLNIEENVKPELILYDTEKGYVLAYKFSNYLQSYVINANTGEVIERVSTFVSDTMEFKGQKGDIHQVFYNDYKNENHNIKNALWDNEKNIFVINNRIDEQYDSILEKNLLKIEDLQSEKNKSAIDGMANTYRAVEYFEKHFNEKINTTYVSVNVDNPELPKEYSGCRYTNEKNQTVAFMVFCIMTNKNKPQNSAYLDIVAHEYTHAITCFLAFGYSKYNEDNRYFERNALMEAYSDIFGELIEKEYIGNTDWYHNTSRNLRKPKINKYSKLDKNTDCDKFAHDNSTIISHTAFLMSKDNRNSKYNNDILLDYDQLGQLWYGSLEYLKKTEFKDFSDCRYAIEESARDLIEKGILVEDNLKVIEQAFNDVEVSSNPARRGAKDSAEIKENHTLVVPIEDETQSIEPVEITEPAITPTESNITAVDLIDKTTPEIISLMNNEYQIIKTESDIYIYIQNQSVFPGMEFYVQVSDDDIISANNGEEIHSDTLKAKLESGELTLDGIQINKSGKVTDSISVGMDYKSCSKALGDFDCIGGNGGYLSGSIESVSHTYNEKNAEIILHFFDIPSKILSDLTSSKISSVSAEEMKSHNPKLKNVVIRKSEANTKSTNLTVNVDSTYIGEITKDDCTHYYTMNINEDNSLFTVQCINSNGVKGGFDLPIDKLENGVYFYTNGSCYDRNQITGERINIFNNLTGTITVNDDGSLLWKTENSLPYELILNPNNMYSKEVLFTGTVNTEKDPLNVRKSPSTEAKIIGRIDKGSTVTVYSESDGWCEIEYNGGIGYVSKEYISCSSGGFAKPVIYLYPKNKQDISVKVNFKNGDFTCTYPEYNNGWNVTAYPDGKIINKADNDEYSYLYWEGEGKMNYDFSSGFIVKKEDTAKFLKEKLSYMGLTPKEYNEFIVYWLPIMQENEYNLISFQTDNYEESAKLEIYPKPDSMLRVFMAFKEVSENTIVPEQKLESFKRNGFTVIEWGGTEIN